jgi:phosphopantetheine--protein transferase-like protein
MKPLPFPYSVNIGTDIVHLSRILRLISRPHNYGKETYLQRFTRRILCDQERLDFRARFPPPPSTPSIIGPRSWNVPITPEMARWLAGRFAAKEAARKAGHGGGASSISWKDVQVRTEGSGSGGRGSGGRPEVVYLNPNGGGHVGKLSISHDGDYVVATVLAAGAG